jgi:hypothetical protein
MSTPGSKWRTDPRGPYIRMHSGEKVYLAQPSPEQIRLRDLAYHAARVHRYTGATEMSIAQHMVVGARMAARFYQSEPKLPARVLIHDAAEHVLGDVSAPLKSLLADYKALESKWDIAVEDRFNLLFVGDPLVRQVDDRMWLTERLVVYGDAMRDGVDISEDYAGPLTPFEITPDELFDNFTPWSPARAEEEYLTELYERLPWIQ